MFHDTPGADALQFCGGEAGADIVQHRAVLPEFLQTIGSDIPEDHIRRGLANAAQGIGAVPEDADDTPDTACPQPPLFSVPNIRLRGGWKAWGGREKTSLRSVVFAMVSSTRFPRSISSGTERVCPSVCIVSPRAVGCTILYFTEPAPSDSASRIISSI